jgi:hypothetical protein
MEATGAMFSGRRFNSMGVLRRSYATNIWASLLLGWLALALLSPNAGKLSAQQPDRRTSFSIIRNTLRVLPACTWISKLPLDTAGGKDVPYMRKMRALGVARAAIVMRGTAHQGYVVGIVATRNIFYNVYDGPQGEITDQLQLARIAQSGLPTELQSAALATASTFPDQPYRMDGPGEEVEGKQVETAVGFADEPWLPRGYAPFFWAEVAALPPLAAAAGREDLAEVMQLLSTFRPPVDQRNAALVIAAQDVFDNMAVMRALIAAGADLHGKGLVLGSHGLRATPLEAAKEQNATCNVENLIQLGASRPQRN